MSRITLITNGHVCSSPRVWREAEALVGAGHEVSVVGVCFTEEEAQADHRLARQLEFQLITAADMRRRRRFEIERNLRRAKRRIAGELGRLGAASIDAIATAPRSILRAARSTRADLYSAHLQAGLWVARALLDDGCRVAMDMEDWHSEEDLQMSAGTQSFLKRLERNVLCRCVYTTAPSLAMAKALSAAYGCREPIVVYNGDPQRMLPALAPAPTGPMRMLWFSQTLGMDRGLSDVCEALGMLGEQVEWRLDLLARSTDASQRRIVAALPPFARSRVRFLALVPHAELPTLVSDYDIGLALERSAPRSRDLTVTNKLLRYLQSGAYVIASNTLGQREVIEGQGALGAIYVSGDANALTVLIRSAAERLERLRAGREQRAVHANARWSYDVQVPKVLSAVEAAVSEP